QPVAPRSGQARPVGHGWRAVVRKLAECFADLVKGQTDRLRNTDERNPAQDLTVEPALAAVGPGRRQQPLPVVVAQRGRGYAGALGYRTDGQPIVRHEVRI